MKTFSEQDAGRAFTELAKARFHNPESGIKPADVCLFCWLVAEAVRVNCNPFSTTATEIFTGFETTANGRKEEIAPVGMSLNTVKASIERLEEAGFIEIGRHPSTRGQRLEVTIKE